MKLSRAVGGRCTGEHSDTLLAKVKISRSAIFTSGTRPGAQMNQNLPHGQLWDDDLMPLQFFGHEYTKFVIVVEILEWREFSDPFESVQIQFVY
jgi:hypothetical protein